MNGFACAIAGATAVVGIWTGAPALVADATQSPPVVIHVTAERFRFTPDEIRVKRGETLEIHLDSDDTDHGFRIVGTAVKQVIPKRGRGEIVVTFAPNRAGRYAFECWKLCGAGHEFMRGRIVVDE